MPTATWRSPGSRICWEAPGGSLPPAPSSAEAPCWSGTRMSGATSTSRRCLLQAGSKPRCSPCCATLIRLAGAPFCSTHAGHVQAFLPPGAPQEGERYLFTGFQLIGAGVLAELPAPPAGMSVVWEALRPRGALLGVVVQGSWHEVGTPWAYRELVTRAPGSGFVGPPTGSGVDEVLASCAVPSARGAGWVRTPACRRAFSTAGAAVDGGCELQRCVVAGPVTLTGAGRVSEALILPQGRFPLR